MVTPPMYETHVWYSPKSTSSQHLMGTLKMIQLKDNPMTGSLEIMVFVGAFLAGRIGRFMTTPEMTLNLGVNDLRTGLGADSSKC